VTSVAIRRAGAEPFPPTGLIATPSGVERLQVVVAGPVEIGAPLEEGFGGRSLAAVAGLPERLATSALDAGVVCNLPLEAIGEPISSRVPEARLLATDCPEGFLDRDSVQAAARWYSWISPAEPVAALDRASPSVVVGGKTKLSSNPGQEQEHGHRLDY
jgi:hypothetical protein